MLLIYGSFHEVASKSDQTLQTQFQTRLKEIGEKLNLIQQSLDAIEKELRVIAEKLQEIGEKLAALQKSLQEKKEKPPLKHTPPEEYGVHVVYSLEQPGETQKRIVPDPNNHKMHLVNDFEGERQIELDELSVDEGPKIIGNVSSTLWLEQSAGSASFAYNYVMYLPPQVDEIRAIAFEIYPADMPLDLFESYHTLRQLVHNGIAIVSVSLSDALNYTGQHKYSGQAAYDEAAFKQLAQDVVTFKEKFKTDIWSYLRRKYPLLPQKYPPMFVMGGSFGGLLTWFLDNDDRLGGEFNGYLAIGYSLPEFLRPNKFEPDVTHLKKPIFVAQGQKDGTSEPDRILFFLHNLYRKNQEDLLGKIYFRMRPDLAHLWDPRDEFVEDMIDFMTEWYKYPQQSQDQKAETTSEYTSGLQDSTLYGAFQVFSLVQKLNPKGYASEYDTILKKLILDYKQRCYCEAFFDDCPIGLRNTTIETILREAKDETYKAFREKARKYFEGIDGTYPDLHITITGSPNKTLSVLSDIIKANEKDPTVIPSIISYMTDRKFKP